MVKVISSILVSSIMLTALATVGLKYYIISIDSICLLLSLNCNYFLLVTAYLICIVLLAIVSGVYIAFSVDVDVLYK